MTITSGAITAGPYTGNGVTTAFAFNFKIIDNDQVLVYETDLDGVQTLLTLTTDYTVAGMGGSSGTVTLTSPLTTGHTLFIISNFEAKQETSFSSQGAFFPAAHEAAFDYLTLLVKQIQYNVDRSFRIDPSTPGSYSLTIVPGAPGEALTWDGAGGLTSESLVGPQGPAGPQGEPGEVSLTASQTLTNKTYSSPLITGPMSLNGSVGSAFQTAMSLGAGQPAVWATILAPRETRTTNTEITSADRAKTIQYTGAGNFTQTWAAVGTFDPVFWIKLINDTTGAITIPSSDGVNNWKMYRGESRIFRVVDGAFVSEIITPFAHQWSASDTWVKPPGYYGFDVNGVGGGSGGQRGGTSSVSSGGGGGGYNERFILSADLAATESITIGAGGARIVSPSTGAAQSGGDTLFGSWLECPGATTSIGGNLSNTNEALEPISSGLSFWGGASASTTPGKNSVKGAGSGAGITTSTVQVGGTSQDAGDGGDSVWDTGSAEDGFFPGGGGGACAGGDQSGKGGDGVLRMRGVK